MWKRLMYWLSAPAGRCPKCKAKYTIFFSGVCWACAEEYVKKERAKHKEEMRRKYE